MRGLVATTIVVGTIVPISDKFLVFSKEAAINLVKIRNLPGVEGFHKMNKTHCME